MPAEPAYVPPMPALMTANELLRPHIPERAEFVRGVLVVREPPGFSHGAIVARLTSLLDDHVRTHELGLVVAGDAGFQLATDPDTVRGADVAFVRRDPYRIRHRWRSPPSRPISPSRSSPLTIGREQHSPRWPIGSRAARDSSG
jgi:Uma2 family endonuclease